MLSCQHEVLISKIFGTEEFFCDAFLVKSFWYSLIH